MLALKLTLSITVETMTIATVLCASLVGLTICSAQSNPPPVFACNLKAIPAAERPLYNDLTKRLRAAVRKPSELPDGYSFQLHDKSITLTDVAAWIALERLCCPFLTFQLSTSGTQPDWVLKLTGAEGVKALLEAEFPAQ
jgi:hypothetical protein